MEWRQKTATSSTLIAMALSLYPKMPSAALPEVVALCMRREEPVLAAARSDGFNIAKLKKAMGSAKDIH